MLRVVLISVVFASMLQAGCIAVKGSQITAGDLAKASSVFTKLDPALIFSFAPPAGSQRMISAAEIQRWAAEQGLSGIDLPSACFETASYVLTPELIASTLKTVLGTDAKQLHIEVLEVCQCKVPDGRLEFPLSGASAPPEGHPETPVLWRGRLIATDGRAYMIWARVKVTGLATVVRAAQNLQAGRPLRREDLEVVEVSASPLRFPAEETIAAYEGKIANIALPRGTILRRDRVHTPSDVERGSLVKVEVINGGAHLVLTARAETGGNAGDVITLTNPTGAARFRANVTGRGHAQVALSTGSFTLAEQQENAGRTAGMDRGY